MDESDLARLTLQLEKESAQIVQLREELWSARKDVVTWKLRVDEACAIIEALEEGNVRLSAQTNKENCDLEVYIPMAIKVAREGDIPPGVAYVKTDIENVVLIFTPITRGEGL